jgi:hypothetical protein
MALLLAPLGGCHSWQATEVPLPLLIAERRPDAIRVTLADSSVVTFERPTIDADSIRGLTPTGNVRAPVEDVRSLEVRRTSVPKSVAFVVSKVAAIVTFVAIIVYVQPHYRGL